MRFYFPLEYQVNAKLLLLEYTQVTQGRRAEAKLYWCSEFLLRNHKLPYIYQL